MKKTCVLLLPFLTFLCSLPVFGQSSILDNLESKTGYYSNIAQQIWDYHELGYQETKSSALLQEVLTEAGFSIEKGVAKIPTAFIASYGSGKPIIGILAEFDALPGVSQAAVPVREELVKGGNGHACGHHLFGTGSTAAAIAIKDWLISSGKSGTIRLYGTPAEEGGAGKVYMVRAGLFDNVDAVLHWHPGDQNSANASSSLANKSAKFRFYGIASHAAASPQNGRSALDAVEAMNYMVNMMREHIPMESRIHYVITDGGKAPNVVPEFAEVYYYIRHPEMEMVHELFERAVNAAKGAALGTDTRMEYEVIHGLYNLLPNETLSQIMFNNLQKVGGVQYSHEETEFAQKLATSLPKNSQKPLVSSEAVQPFKVINKGRSGSTDVGDVSWMVPTAGMQAATWVPGTSAHSWQAVAAGGMSIGKKGMMVAAKTLALTAIDLFSHPETCEKSKQELLGKRSAGFVYKPLLGDREPPLDYRN